jgi:hypothetical protein
MATLIAVASDPRTPLNTFSYHVEGDEVIISDLIKVEPVRYHARRAGITPTQEAQIRAQRLERMGWTITWAEGQEPA